MKSDTRVCPQCKQPFQRLGKGSGSWPRFCHSCKPTLRSKRGETNGTRPRKPTSVGTSHEVVEAEVHEAESPDVVAFIEAMQLDYCVGSAVRFLAEIRDGDELGNLVFARDYIERAIRARGGEVGA